jgi:hypothetical protein
VENQKVVDEHAKENIKTPKKRAENERNAHKKQEEKNKLLKF